MRHRKTIDAAAVLAVVTTLVTAMPAFASAPALAGLQRPGITLSAAVPDLEIICMASALYHEARGEGREGQKAVAQVILNRMKSDAYPATACGVIYQNMNKKNACQFSFACDGVADTPKEKGAYQKSLSLAEKAIRDGVSAKALAVDPHDPKSAKRAQVTHYHTVNVHPAWERKIEKIAKIGSHIFYRSARVAKSL